MRGDMIDAILKKIAGNQKILTVLAGLGGAALASYGIEWSPEGDIQSLDGWAVFFALLVAFGTAGGTKIAAERVKRQERIDSGEASPLEKIVIEKADPAGKEK